jgi:DNA-binding MarR family transcriptional regulator
VFCKHNSSVEAKLNVLKLEDAIKTSGFKDQKQKAVVNIMYTAYKVKSTISNTLKEFSLTPEQYNVMRILKGKHPEQMCVKDIAQRLIERSSNVPRILDRLEAKKLIQRSQSLVDKRETAVNLSNAGIDLLEIANVALEKTNNGMSLLSELEIQQLNELLDRYLKD